MRLILALLLCCSAWSTTVLRMACGGPGGVDAAGTVWAADASFSGGAAWTTVNQPALAALDIPYRSLRYSSPAGAPFSYTLQLAPGQYLVTLKFLEPNKAAAGQRVFNVSVNGAPAAVGLDVFIMASGALKPYYVAVPVTTATGQIQISLTATVGNAVISGIQVDSVDLPPAIQRDICEVPFGEGSSSGGNIFTGVYTLWACWNLSGLDVRVTSVRCASDAAGTVLDVMLPDSAGALHTILDAPIVCGIPPAPVLPTVVAGVSYPDGQFLRLFLRVSEQTAGASTASQIVVVVGLESDLVPKLAALEQCSGSGPGWDCGGLLRARLAKPDGTPVLLVGAPMADTPNPLVTWSAAK